MPRFRRPKSEAKIYLRGILPTLTPADFVSEMIAARAKKIKTARNGKSGNPERRCICGSFDA